MNMHSDAHPLNHGGVGVIINPGSGRGNGKGEALRNKLGRVAGVHVVFLENFAQLEAALIEIAHKGVHTLFVSSGDGTIQAVQSFIAESGLFNVTPALCLLPHGTTNMTAYDLGFTRRSISEQAAFIINPVPHSVTKRPTLRIPNARDGKVRHGMFLGTGAAATATRHCQTAFNDKGVRGNLAALATLTRAAGKAVFFRPNPADTTRLDRPFDITVHTDDAQLCTGPQLLALATTLNQLVIGVRPFWGGATAPIRASSFPYPLPNVVRWLLPAIRGGENRNAPPGAVSRAARHVTIATNAECVIDGEFFMPPLNEPLQIEVGRTFTYILA